MKQPTLLLSLLLILFLGFSEEALAQSKGKQGPPPWAPAHGYRAKTRHVYFPQHNFYFDMQRGVYIFLNGGKWQIGASLPTLYAKLDLRRATQIELDLTSDSPHHHNADHKLKFKAKPQRHAPAAKHHGPAPGKAKPGKQGKGKKH